MLPRSRRISRVLFPSLTSSRRFVHSTHLTLRYVANSTPSRVAVTVSKKVAKSAAVRNTLRRRVSAAVAKRLSSLPKGLFLFVAKQGAINLKGKVLDIELDSLLKNL